MKPRYKKGDKVKLYKAIHPLDREYVGKIFTIASHYSGFCGTDNWYTLSGLNVGFREDQLKKYAPSRTGTRDPKTGRFVSKYGYLADMPSSKIKMADFGFGTNTDSKQRNYQKIEKLNDSYHNYVSSTVLIETMLFKINEIIDELGRRV